MNRKNHTLKKITHCILSIFAISILLTIANSCAKTETQIKKDPVITWENPADIPFGTLLSETQLNAYADVPGLFEYTPAIGIQLNEGKNQALKTVFSPFDKAYNSISKTVYINVKNNDITDADGNVYHSVKIGTQTWMVENLRTTTYNDGQKISTTSGQTMAWDNLLNGGYCNLYDNVSYVTKYGRLYNWYAVNTGKLCPKGWHVPIDAEWETLQSFLDTNSGGKMKSINGWNSPNTGATNSSGFSGLPGGFVGGSGYMQEGNYGRWWSSTEYDRKLGWSIYLSASNGICYRMYYEKQYGFSIRCIKD